MNLRFIETFVLLARLGSFRATAERLNTTQPAVSARIHALERELGVVLFLRGGRGAQLTPEGVEALRHAETVLAGWEAMCQAAAGPEAYAGAVRIGAIDAVVRTWLPGLIERLRTALPRATVEITADTSINLARGVESGEIHLAFIIDPPGGSRGALRRSLRHWRRRRHRAPAQGPTRSPALAATPAPGPGPGAAAPDARWFARPICTFAMAWVASPDLVAADRPARPGRGRPPADHHLPGRHAALPADRRLSGRRRPAQPAGEFVELAVDHDPPRRRRPRPRGDPAGLHRPPAWPTAN